MLPTPERQLLYLRERPRSDASYQAMEQRCQVAERAMVTYPKNGRGGTSLFERDFAQVLGDVKEGSNVLILPRTVQNPLTPMSFAALIGRVNSLRVMGRASEKDRSGVTVVSRDRTDPGFLYTSIFELLCNLNHLKADKGLNSGDQITAYMRQFHRTYIKGIQAMVRSHYMDKKDATSFEQAKAERRLEKYRDSFFSSYHLSHIAGRSPEVLAKLPDNSFDAVLVLDQMAHQPPALAMPEVAKPRFFEELRRITRSEAKILIHESTAIGATDAYYYGQMVLADSFLVDDLRNVQEPVLWLAYQKSHVARQAHAMLSPKPRIELASAGESVVPAAKDQLCQEKTVFTNWFLKTIQPDLGVLKPSTDEWWEAASVAAHEQVSVTRLREAGLPMLSIFMRGFDGKLENVLREAQKMSAPQPKSDK